MKYKRKLVLVCTGKDCKKEGAKKLQKELENEPELKGKCKWIKTRCLDHCKSAPMVVVGDFFCKKATVHKVAEIIKKS
ncbi:MULTISPECIES: (2Fe-2S) ferredoxin domain-containing protein [Algoriphagus]|uniref:Thioredoxin-like [2Fe-2S] ferredoxin n=1 Tax=Algoriphagus taiwanensis TaxID=1445656 RepID=A0ABQ6PXS9_9BACT|nr:hypothetical protein Aoki45_06960 [Algoriphagus sp. oki45]GMQ32729.1 hypothetical protein Ataiwa_10010 [Algoriphagus taiwanensis]